MTGKLNKNDIEQRDNRRNKKSGKEIKVQYI